MLSAHIGIASIICVVKKNPVFWNVNNCFNLELPHYLKLRETICAILA